MEIRFAERLKALRIEAGLSQEKLAEALQATQRKVSYWELGKIESDLCSLYKIADYFDVSTDFLIGRSEM